MFFLFFSCFQIRGLANQTVGLDVFALGSSCCWEMIVATRSSLSQAWVKPLHREPKQRLQTIPFFFLTKLTINENAVTPQVKPLAIDSMVLAMQVMCKSKYEARYQKRKMCLVNLYEFQEHRFAQITMPQGNLAKVPVHTVHSTDE